ncbi:carboxymuconolactone decarboxylase family protein [Enterobacteriaceae bacterium 89]|nr:carboxymuconolactone decarboxylase family protein [Enterobacteriaceae bacterium 89]
MNRLNVPTFDNAPEASKPTLEAVNKKLGVVPNLFRLIASSPAALAGYMSFNDALTKTLDAKTRERIALAVAQVNGCDYCLSAHSYIGMNMLKMTPEEISLNRQGQSGDVKANAAVRFATFVAKQRGKVSDEEIQKVRDAGFSDAQLVEIVALVAESTFTNYLNNVALTDIDFPVVHAED